MRTTFEGHARTAAAVAVVGLFTLAACAHSGRSAEARPDPNAANAADWRGQTPGRVEELFAGRFPGVQAFASGGGMVVRVRGASSFGGGSDPLYVVDGIAVTPGTNGLLPINPAEVARIEVLKDAADLASYGSRAGNGVVRITTKRARR